MRLPAPLARVASKVDRSGPGSWMRRQLRARGFPRRFRPASFVDCLEKSVRLRVIVQSAGKDLAIWKLDDKLVGRAFAQQLGLRVPVLRITGSIEECVEEVLKSGSGSSNRDRNIPPEVWWL